MTVILKWKLHESIQVIFVIIRDELDWQMAPQSPLDYCYVRPQHIPSVNALCREFFWPGIDCKYI